MGDCEAGCLGEIGGGIEVILLGVGYSGFGGKEEEEECWISVEERGSSGALSSLDCSRKKKEALGSSGGAFSCVRAASSTGPLGLQVRRQLRAKEGWRQASDGTATAGGACWSGLSRRMAERRTVRCRTMSCRMQKEFCREKREKKTRRSGRGRRREEEELVVGWAVRKGKKRKKEKKGGGETGRTRPKKGERKERKKNRKEERKEEEKGEK